MTYYMKGQSDYDSVNFHMGFFFDMNGFPSGDYATVVMPDDVTQGDPFLAVAAETIPTWTPGSAVVEIGLWDDYRIKVDTAGIWGWHEGSGDWFSLFGGGGVGGDNLGNHIATQDLVMGTNKITGLGNGSSAQDAMAFGQRYADSDVESVITAELAEGESIDLAIDSLILAHKNISTAHHSPPVAGDFSHNSLANLNAGDNYEHITQGQKDLLHSIYTLESHNNTYHSVTFVDAAGAVAAVEAVGLTLASSQVITSGNQDILFTFGRTTVGGHTSYVDHAFFSHRGQASPGNYGLLQKNDGTTYLNAASGRTIHFGIYHSDKMALNATNLTMSVPIAMGTSKITGLGDGSATQDAMAFGQKYTDAEVQALSINNVSEDNDPSLGGPLDLNSKPFTEELVAAVALVNGNLCYMNGSGKMDKAQGDAEATCDTLLAMCTETISADATGTFILWGRYITTGLTAGVNYYVSDITAGAITLTKPSTAGDIIRLVGTAVSTTVLFFRPSEDYIEYV